MYVFFVILYNFCLFSMFFLVKMSDNNNLKVFAVFRFQFEKQNGLHPYNL